MKVKQWRYSLTSISSHVILFILSFHVIEREELKTSLSYFPAYIASQSNCDDFLQNNKSRIAPKNKAGFVAESMEKKISYKKHVPFKSEEINKEITHRILLKILHDQIAAKQIYPESALQLNESGQVTIRFVLDPNGLIHDIVLVKSSGFVSIDVAALNAVKAISRVENINNYLEDKERFSIDILFQ